MPWRNCHWELHHREPSVMMSGVGWRGEDCAGTDDAARKAGVPGGLLSAQVLAPQAHKGWIYRKTMLSFAFDLRLRGRIGTHTFSVVEGGQRSDDSNVVGRGMCSSSIMAIGTS